MNKPHTLKTQQLWLVTLALCISYALLVIGIAEDLPYHLDPDEPVLIINANELVTAGQVMHKPNYPPLFVWQLSGQRLLLDTLNGSEAGDSAYFFAGRVASIGYGLLYLATAFALFRRFGAFLPALVMMLFLALEPEAIRLHSLAKADAISIFLAVLSLLLAWRSWHSFPHHTQRGLTFVAFSFVVGLASILAKYNFLPVLIAPTLVLLWYSIRLRWWWLLGGGTLVVLIAGLGVMLSPVGASLIIYVNNYDANLLAMPSMDSQFAYFMRFGGWASWIALGYIALLVWRAVQGKATRQDQFGWVLIATFVGGFILYSATDWSHYRYSYLLFVLLALAICYCVTWLQAHSHWLVGVAIGVILLGWRAPMALDIVSIRFEVAPQIRTGNWLAEAIDEPVVVVIERDNNLINRQYSGIPLEHPVGEIVVDSLLEQPLEDYRVQGTDYLIADARARSGYFYSDIPATFRNQTREVYRDHPDSPQYIIFELLPPPREYATRAPEGFTSADVRFGTAVGLDSYQISFDEERLLFSLAWQGMETNEDFTYFVQINERETGEQIANVNQMPLNYQLSTSLLYADEVLVDPLSIDLASAPSGCYQITIGWYHPDTGERLPAISADGTPLAEASYRVPQPIGIFDAGYQIGCEDQAPE